MAAFSVTKFRSIILAAALAAPSLGLAQDPAPPGLAPDLAPAAAGEFGLRYWLSTGETRIAHNAQGANPAFGNPTSILTYENLDANSLELFGRAPLGTNWFLKVLFGLGNINTGSFDDEDYFRGQVKFSDTTSSITKGTIAYGAIDIGHQWLLRQGTIGLGVFGGFSQWTEEYDAYGATATVGTINISNNVRVITNKVRWRALRLGFNGQFVFGKSRLGVDVAAVPYAKYYNEDSHHLRADLGPTPNIIDSGEGWGVQLDAEYRYEIAPNTHLGVGARYWRMEADSGTSDFHNFPNAKTPIVEFYTWRAGLMLSLRHSF